MVYFMSENNLIHIMCWTAGVSGHRHFNDFINYFQLIQLIIWCYDINEQCLMLLGNYHREFSRATYGGLEITKSVSALH